LELGQYALSAQPEEPLERVEHELLDGQHRKNAGPFTSRVSAHAIGHDEEVSALVAEQGLGLRETRLSDAQDARQLGGEKVIFVRLPKQSPVGKPKAPDGSMRTVVRYCYVAPASGT